MDDPSSKSEDTTATPSAEQRDSEEPMLYCPVCSRKLAQLKCKLICERCGYYMSCADYY
jgi:hypothetical protein